MKYLLSIFSLFFIINATLAQNYDKRNGWRAKTFGTATIQEKWSCNRNAVRIEINTGRTFKLNPGVGAIKGYGSACGYSATITLPDNYQDIRGLSIGSSHISFSATRKHPFSLNLKWSQDEYGDKVLKGEITYFKVNDNGDLSLWNKYSNIRAYID